MIKKSAVFLILSSIIIFLSGCVGYRETNECLTVSLIGIDRAGEDIKITVQTILADTEGKVDCETVNATGKDIETAFSKLCEKTVKPLILEHCVGTALGSTLNNNDIIAFLDFAEQKTDINLSLNFFYTPKADEFLIDSGNYRQGGYDIIELIKNNRNTFQNKLFMIKRELNKGKGAKIPVLSFKGDEAVIENTVILEGLGSFEN